GSAVDGDRPDSLKRRTNQLNGLRVLFFNGESVSELSDLPSRARTGPAVFNSQCTLRSTISLGFTCSAAKSPLLERRRTKVSTLSAAKLPPTGIFASSGSATES